MLPPVRQGATTEIMEPRRLRFVILFAVRQKDRKTGGRLGDAIASPKSFFRECPPFFLKKKKARTGLSDMHSRISELEDENPLSDEDLGQQGGKETGRVLFYPFPPSGG